MPQQLDPPDALDIAMRCVKAESGEDCQEGDTLDDVGIPDDLAINGLKDTIVHGSVGVQQDGYSMKTSDLDGMSPSWTVGKTGRRIRETAVPVGGEEV